MTGSVTKAYNSLIEQVFEGKDTFNRQEGLEIFAAGVLMTAKTQLSSDEQKILVFAVMAEIWSEEIKH